MKSVVHTVLLALCVLFLGACATYYQKNLTFQGYLSRQEFDKASKSLDQNKKLQKERNKLLYYFDKGTVAQLNGEYEQSNQYFEQAYYYIEDYSKSLGRTALSMFTNPSVQKYGGEDFEIVLLHYYKAMNYALMKEYEKSLVECRRINIRLNELGDKFKSERKYKRDAFAHNLMGIVYEASGDINNAFIAYRNAYEVYDEDYSRFFGMDAPKQLKKDLVRAAALNGFYDIQRRYEEEFGIQYDGQRHKKELVYFWHNGLGPIKSEWSINFAVVRGEGGYVAFVNEELGLDFGFRTRSDDEYNSLGDLKVVRVAFPKYVERGEVYRGAQLLLGPEKYPLEKAEDINQIAFKSLNDRMMRELGNALLRLALKQAAEQSVRSENQDLGALVSMVNALTEKADTRNWQTLPHSISYARIPVTDEPQEIKLEVQTQGKRAVVMTDSVASDGDAITMKLYHSLAGRVFMP